MKTYAVCFSGGKDSILALDRAVRRGLNVKYLVNIYDASTDRVRFHGFRKEVIQKQAEALALELIQSGSTNENFEQVFMEGLGILKNIGVAGVVFGDIHLINVKNWFEERTVSLRLEHIEPLWLDPPVNLVREMVNRGYKATLTSLDLEQTKPEWLGKIITSGLINEFIGAGIDPCGENGEYHSFVSDGPLFKTAIDFKLASIYKSPTHSSIDIQLQ